MTINGNNYRTISEKQYSLDKTNENRFMDKINSYSIDFVQLFVPGSYNGSQYPSAEPTTECNLPLYF